MKVDIFRAGTAGYRAKNVTLHTDRTLHDVNLSFVTFTQSYYKLYGI